MTPDSAWCSAAVKITGGNFRATSDRSAALPTEVYPQLEGAAIITRGVERLRYVEPLPHFGRLSAHVYFAPVIPGGVLARTRRTTDYRAFTANQSGSTCLHAANAAIPSGRWLRWPGLVLGMTYFALRDPNLTKRTRQARRAITSEITMPTVITPMNNVAVH